MNTAEKFVIAIAILAVLSIAGIALYVAIKAHLHHTTLAAEVKNQGDKVEAIDTKVVDAVKAEVATVKADIVAKV